LTYSNYDEKLCEGILKVPVEIDRDELLLKYQFAYDHAPKMWLNEKPDDPWFPSTLEFFLN
jgi:hypothetical protein